MPTAIFTQSFPVAKQVQSENNTVNTGQAIHAKWTECVKEAEKEDVMGGGGR